MMLKLRLLTAVLLVVALAWLTLRHKVRSAGPSPSTPLELALEKPWPAVRWEGASLRDVLDEVAARLPPKTIEVRWEQLANVGVRPDTQVSLMVRGLPVADVLHRLIQQPDLAGLADFAAVEGKLVLTSASQVSAMSVVHDYDVAPLVRRTELVPSGGYAIGGMCSLAPARDIPAGEWLAAVIGKSALPPDSYPLLASGRNHLFDGRLLVRANWWDHRCIRNTLDRLRDPSRVAFTDWPTPDRSFPRADDPDRVNDRYVTRTYDVRKLMAWLFDAPVDADDSRFANAFDGVVRANLNEQHFAETTVSELGPLASTPLAGDRASLRISMGILTMHDTWEKHERLTRFLDELAAEPPKP